MTMCLTLTNCLTFLGVNAKAKENKRTFDAAKYKLLKSNEDTHFEEFENSGYTVLKWIMATDLSATQAFIFELNMSTDKEEFRFRVENFALNQSKTPSRVQCAYSGSGLDIYNLYQQHLKPYLNETKFTLTSALIDSVHGSSGLQKLAWKSKINKSSVGPSLSKETTQLVSTIWRAAVGDLSDLFEEDLLSGLTVEAVNKSECILQKQREELEKISNNIEMGNCKSSSYIFRFRGLNQAKIICIRMKIFK